jgi:uncharacterized protein DUF1360
VVTDRRVVDPLELVVDVLATYRLTRLATADIISEPARQTAVTRLLRGSDVLDEPGPERTAQELVEAVKDPPKLARLITCRWCAGVWIAGGVVAARILAPRMWDPVAMGLALSSGAALLAGLEDR